MTEKEYWRRAFIIIFILMLLLILAGRVFKIGEEQLPQPPPPPSPQTQPLSEKLPIAGSFY